jgi:hypothetical protein
VALVPGRTVKGVPQNLDTRLFAALHVSAFGRHKAESGGGRLSFICVPSTSRGHDGERAFHLLLNALNGAVADAAFAGNLQHAFACAQLSLDALFERGHRSEADRAACPARPRA